MKAKHFAACAAALLLGGCLPTLSGSAIIVDGEATLEFEPDVFVVTGTIRSRTETPNEALSAMSNTLRSLRESLPRLESLTGVSIDAAGATIQPVQDRACLDEANYRQAGACPVISHFGQIELRITGSPAARVGQTVSLLSELGVEEVSLEQYSLIDLEKARAQAAAKAMEDARAKAQRIAEAAGTTVGKLTKVQFGGGFAEEYEERVYALAYAPDAQDRAAPVISPQIDLDIAPQPIKVRAKVVAAFAVD